MEYKDPMFELMSSLEQIVFKKDVAQTGTLSKKPNSFSDFEQLRRGTGLKIDDFARAMGVSVSMVHELGEMEREAMSEIGNIVLNACVGTLANMFQKELQGSLPVVRVGSSEEILNPEKDKNDPLVMMLRIDFALERQQIQGYLAFILDMSALCDLREQVRLYISRLESGSVPSGMH